MEEYHVQSNVVLLALLFVVPEREQQISDISC
jgi:hypothetical protein